MENKKLQIFSDRNIASLLLISMSIQYIPIDGWGTSYIKTIISVFSFFFFISRSRYISKAVMLSFVFMVALCVVYFLQFSDKGGGLTILHKLLYLITFCLFYNLVYHNKAYSIDSFIKLIEFIIYIFTITLIVQQVLFLLGLHYFPLANIYGQDYYSVMRLPSLSREPSHTARILVVSLYALLRGAEYKTGRTLSLKELYYSYKKPLLCSIYSLICIGSGTAMVGVAIILLYFIRRQYSVAVVFFAFVFYYTVPYIDYEPLTRAINVFDATLTADINEVKKIDNSGSARVGPILGLITYFDIANPKLWLGYGPNISMITLTIDTYGLFVYALLLLLIGVCCICDIQGFLFFVILLSLDVRNFAYAYAMLMILSAVKYFKQNRVRL